MNRVWKRGATALLSLVIATAATLWAARMPTTAWAQWGRRAAQVVVGLSRPEESLQYIRQAVLTEPTAAPVFLEADVEALKAETAAIPARGEGGAVKETVIRGEVSHGVSVKNTSGTVYDIASLIGQGLPLTARVSDDVRVLIVHTHTTECYLSYDAGYYNHTDPTRSQDPAENMIAVGEAVAQELRASGVGVIHDTTLHDYPAYTGAYARSEQTIQTWLERYPTIDVVLDLHRDAMMQADGTKLKPTVTVQGHKAAQVMAVIGGTNRESRPNAWCNENLRLALAFYQAMERAYPSVMRPIYLLDARYNQGLKAGSMLLEIGTDANTLSEAVFSGHLVGRQLAGLLNGG